MTTNPAPLQGRRQARKLLLIGLTLVAIEALAYVVVGVIAITSVSAGKAADSAGIGLFLVVYGVAQLFAAHKLLQWHTWARGPLVFTQLIQLGLAWGLRHSDQQWLSAVMAVAAALTLGCLLAPSVTRALIDDEAV